MVVARQALRKRTTVRSDGQSLSGWIRFFCPQIAQVVADVFWAKIVGRLAEATTLSFVDGSATHSTGIAM